MDANALASGVALVQAELESVDEQIREGNMKVASMQVQLSTIQSSRHKKMKEALHRGQELARCQHRLANVRTGLKRLQTHQQDDSRHLQARLAALKAKREELKIQVKEFEQSSATFCEAYNLPRLLKRWDDLVARLEDVHDKTREAVSRCKVIFQANKRYHQQVKELEEEVSKSSLGLEEAGQHLAACLRECQEMKDQLDVLHHQRQEQAEKEEIMKEVERKLEELMQLQCCVACQEAEMQRAHLEILEVRRRLQGKREVLADIMRAVGALDPGLEPLEGSMGHPGGSPSAQRVPPGRGPVGAAPATGPGQVKVEAAAQCLSSEGATAQNPSGREPRGNDGPAGDVAAEPHDVPRPDGAGEEEEQHRQGARTTEVPCTEYIVEEPATQQLPDGDDPPHESPQQAPGRRVTYQETVITRTMHSQDGAVLQDTMTVREVAAPLPGACTRPRQRMTIRPDVFKYSQGLPEAARHLLDGRKTGNQDGHWTRRHAEGQGRGEVGPEPRWQSFNRSGPPAAPSWPLDLSSRVSRPPGSCPPAVVTDIDPDQPVGAHAAVLDVEDEEMELQGHRLRSLKKHEGPTSTIFPGEEGGVPPVHINAPRPRSSWKPMGPPPTKKPGGNCPAQWHGHYPAPSQDQGAMGTGGLRSNRWGEIGAPSGVQKSRPGAPAGPSEHTRPPQPFTAQKKPAPLILEPSSSSMVERGDDGFEDLDLEDLELIDMVASGGIIGGAGGEPLRSAPPVWPGQNFTKGSPETLTIKQQHGPSCAVTPPAGAAVRGGQSHHMTSGPSHAATDQQGQKRPPHRPVGHLKGLRGTKKTRDNGQHHGESAPGGGRRAGTTEGGAPRRSAKKTRGGTGGPRQAPVDVFGGRSHWGLQ